MTKVTDQPLPSLATPGAWVEPWVSEAGVAPYQQVRPNQAGSRIELPVQTAVVRALRDAEGQVTKYTALVKREPGFNPPSDLWFAVYDSQAQPARDELGAIMQATMPPASTCHLTRADRRLRVRVADELRCEASACCR